MVAPYTGAWIEIRLLVECPNDALSLPTRERGLKFNFYIYYTSMSAVAPYTGAWIEIKTLKKDFSGLAVAPYTGAWIEICCNVTVCVVSLSLPTRERGLKSRRRAE